MVPFRFILEDYVQLVKQCCFELVGRARTPCEVGMRLNTKLDPWQITTNQQIHKKVKDDLKGDILSSESLNYQDWSCKFKGLKM